MKPLTELFTSTGDVFGTWSQIAAPEVIDIIAAAGFRFTVIDAEHGSFGMEAVENLVRACDAAGLLPVVRVPTNEQAHITRALDAGAAGVVIPGVSSLADAERAVAGGKFAPSGARGACPCVRAGGHFVSDWPGYSAQRERDTGIIILAETPGAVADIEAICALPGLRAVMVGPFDLAVAMGLHGDYRHPDAVAATQRILAAAQANGVPTMMPVFAPELAETTAQVEQWREEGVNVFIVGTDKILLHSQCARFVSGLGRSPVQSPSL